MTKMIKEYPYTINNHTIILKQYDVIYTHNGIYKIYELNSDGEGKIAQMGYDEESQDVFPIESASWLCKDDMKRLAWDKYLGER